MNKIGRKWAIFVITILYIIGPTIMAFVNDWEFLFIGRIVIGLGIGASAVVSPQYMGEIAPKEVRGALVSAYEAMLCFGMLVAFLLDFALARALPDDLAWRFMVGMPALLCIVQLLIPFVLPESPQYLNFKDKNEECMVVLRKIYETAEQRASETPSKRTKAEFKKISKENQRQAELLKDLEKEAPPCPSLSCCDNGCCRRTASLAKTLLCEEEKQAFYLVSVMAVVNQLCASTSIINYGPTILNEVLLASSGDSSDASTLVNVTNTTTVAAAPTDPTCFKEPSDESDFTLSILLSTLIPLFKFIGVIGSMFLIDSEWGGRRRLLLAGSYAMGAGMILLAIAATINSLGLVVFALIFFIFSFSASWAGGFWVIVSEVFSMRTKAAAASIVTSILFTAGAVADFTFLSLMDFMGYWSFLIYAAICIAGGVYLQFKLPETQGKTLVEVQELLRKPQVSCFRAQEFAELEESDKGVALGVDEDSDGDDDLEQQHQDEYEDAEVIL